MKPTEEHMSSIITGVIALDNKPSTDIIDAIKKFKYHKGFAFGFKGWVDIRLILVTMDDKNIVTNKKGKEVIQVYKVIALSFNTLNGRGVIMNSLWIMMR